VRPLRSVRWKEWSSGTVRESQLQARYRDDSPTVSDAHAQLLLREAEMARLQAEQALAVQQERNQTMVAMKASNARVAQAASSLDNVRNQLRAMAAAEAELQNLERNRALLDDDYRNLVKIRNQRQVVEHVDSNQASVRVLEPPEVPAMPNPTRRLVLLAGLVISIVLGALVALLSHFFSSVFLLPEGLELETGLPVLACIPESRSFARAAITVQPT